MNLVDQCAVWSFIVWRTELEEVTRMKRPSKIRLPNPKQPLGSGLSDWEKLFQAVPKRLKTYQLPLWPNRLAIWPLLSRCSSVRPSIRAPRPPWLSVWPPTAAAAVSCPNNYLIPLNEDSKWPHLPTTFILPGCSRVREIGHIPPGKTEKRGC